MYRADGPAEMRPVGEVEFVQGLAAASASGIYGPCRAAAAIIGHADLKLGDRVEPVLEALQAASPNRFRGIRHIVTWDPTREVESRDEARARWRRTNSAPAPGCWRGWDCRSTRWLLLPAAPGAGGVRAGRARADDHPEPPRRAVAAPAPTPAATTR